jgi:hypothetical protein
MSDTLTRAFQLREEARLAEKQGNIERAEVLYVESKEIFLQNGDNYLIDAARNLNSIASMKEKQNDHPGALQAAEGSIQLLRNYADACTNGLADQIRFQAWGIIGSIQHAILE